MGSTDEPPVEEQQEHDDRLRKEKVRKRENKTARQKKPHALACATANQKATSTLLDQESHGES